MLIVLLILFIIMIIIGCYLIYKSDVYYCFKNSLGIAFNVIGGILAFFTLVILIVGTVMITQSSIINQKINMYEIENKQIQQDIKLTVADYMKWESDTYEKFAEVEPLFIVNMYPELKSSELVNTQIEIYLSNKQEIKQLKSQKLDYEVWKWWVYFG